MNSIPIRVIAPDNPADQTRHDEIVTLVEKTLRLHRERKEEAEKEGVESQEYKQFKNDIAETDRRIDAIVYELYGLTDEEIRIVEALQKDTLQKVLDDLELLCNRATQ